MALVLELKPYDVVQIGEDIYVSLVEKSGNRCKLVIEAPQALAIARIPNRADVTRRVRKRQDEGEESK